MRKVVEGKRGEKQKWKTLPSTPCSGILQDGEEKEQHLALIREDANWKQGFGGRRCGGYLRTTGVTHMYPKPRHSGSPVI